MPIASQPANPFTGQVHHLGYVVADLESAIHAWISQLGAGPFFILRKPPLTVTSNGQPGTFDHSSAFARWGGIFVELMQLDTIAPEAAQEAMSQQAPQLNHIAFASSEVDASIGALEKADFPQFLRASIGEIDFSLHDARGLCGHNIEVHADSAGFQRFYQQIVDASVNWDGSDPIRDPQF